MTKLMLELALRELAGSSGWSSIFLRYFNAAGADASGEIGETHNPETHLIPLVLKAAAGELETLSIYGDDYDTLDGTCIRDYIHVTDLSTAHFSALSKVLSEQVAEGINLGIEKGASVKEIIKVCEKITGKKVPITVAARRAGDPPRLVANAAKARDVLHWKPEFDLNSIVSSAWKWQCHQHKVDRRARQLNSNRTQASNAVHLLL